ncbi:MAG: aquaporin [Erysipelotrichaceae bacterium]|nr:aquaporin [Erysipelotrichaceae bacterium]
MAKFDVRKFVAEALGTMVLVLVACGVAVFTNADVVATSLAFGLVIVAMAYVIGPVSGCHINPAVSFGMALNKRITWLEFLFYILAQFIGAIVGAASLYLIVVYTTDVPVALGTNGYRFDTVTGNINLVGALTVEVILTFIFVLVILAVTGKRSGAGKKAGLIIGFTLVLVHLIGIPLTGTSVNPARSFGPALMMLFDGKTVPISQVWVFIVAPLAGAALAALVAKYLLKSETPVEAVNPEAK